MPCDNLPHNGEVATRVVRDLAELVDPGLAGWVADSVSYVTTMVDRITPRTTEEDVRAVAEATGLEDRAPVATEPFHEWVLSGSFSGGRPRWEEAGATFTEDIAPFEDRKLWLLNGGHSLLAYAGSARGHETVAEAVADDLPGMARGMVGRSRQVPALPRARRGRLPGRPAGPVRQPADAPPAGPDRRRRLAEAPGPGPADPAPGAGRRSAPSGRHSRPGRLGMPPAGAGVPVRDARADELAPLAKGPLPEAVPRILAALDPAAGGDDDVVTAVTAQARQFEQQGRP